MYRVLLYLGKYGVFIYIYIYIYINMKCMHTVYRNLYSESLQSETC